MIKSLFQKDNATATTSALLQELGVKFNYSILRDNLQNHPDFPSLLAVSDILTGLNVPHEASRLDKSSFNPEDLIYPFLAHLKDEGGQFILIYKITAEKIIYRDHQHKKEEMSMAHFLKNWDGIILQAEADEESAETDYWKNRPGEILKSAIIPGLILSVILLMFPLLYSQTLNWFTPALSLLKIAGTAVSILLLMHSVDVNNPLLQNLCGLGNKNDCNGILKSDAAKLTNWLSWSEVGFFYFSGSLILLLTDPGSAGLLSILNLAALPYTIYSITYQYRAKNWCILCCTVQVILVAEAITFITSNHLSFNVFHTNPVAVILSFTLPVLIWAFLKPFFMQSAQFKTLNQQFRKFKYNTDLFRQILTRQPGIEVSDELLPIVLGNTEASTVITMVSNPFCAPCAKAHKKVEELLTGRDDILLKIIFTTTNNDDDPRTQVARHLSALSRLDNKIIVKQALTDWYDDSNKNYENWAKAYPVSFDADINTVTERQNSWCDTADIQFTPTFLINGYKLPDPYQLDDLQFLLN